MSVDGVLLDQVEWDGGAQYPTGTGESLSLSGAATDVTSNDDPASWCASVDAFGAGDLGTPGMPNPDCPFVAPNLPPMADLVCPAIGQVGQPLSFDATGSLDPDGAIFDYSFDFGDGQGLSDLSGMATHTFTAPDTYEVAVTVTDNRGGTDTVSCSVEVFPNFVTVVIDPGVNFSSLNSTRSFTIDDVPPAVTDTTLRWQHAACGGDTSDVNFVINGQSTEVATNTTSASCSFQNPSRTLSATTINDARDANGTISASARGDDRCQAGVGCATLNDPIFRSLVLEMQVPAPVPRLSCPSVAEVGEIVALDGLASSAHWRDLEDYTFEDVGVGTIASGIQPAVGHAFTTVGTHTVELTVTDFFGTESTASCDIDVVAP
jgi:PKD repeat protein